MEELDTNWVSEYENNEIKYNKLYENSNNKIKIFSLYINSHCVLDKVKRDIINLDQSNLLSKKQLLHLIKSKKIDDGLNYKLISLLSFNVDLKPNEINLYLDERKKFNFYQNHRELTDINFKDTIIMFQDLNCLFFIYFETSAKKLYPNKTKKIYFNTSKRKTKKNNLKEKQEINQL